MIETGELFLVYRECDEDRSSEAAMGEGGGARSAPLCELKKANAQVATVLGSIPASVGTVESEGRQMKQC
jgi:hypothetical protein